MTRVATTTRQSRRRPVQGRLSKGEIEDLRLTVVPAEVPPQGPAAVRDAVNILARWLVRYREEQRKSSGKVLDRSPRERPYVIDK